MSGLIGLLGSAAGSAASTAGSAAGAVGSAAGATASTAGSAAGAVGSAAGSSAGSVASAIGQAGAAASKAAGVGVGKVIGAGAGLAPAGGGIPLASVPSAPAVGAGTGNGTMVGNYLNNKFNPGNPQQGTMVGNYLNNRYGDGTNPDGSQQGDQGSGQQQQQKQQSNLGNPTTPVATPSPIPAIPLAYGADGQAGTQGYAEGGPTMPRGVAKIPAFHLPSMGVKVFRPHLMNTSHPHTSTIKPGSSAGANPRASTGMSMRGMGSGAMRSAPMGAVDNKSGGMPAGGGTPAGIGAGSPAAYAEGGAIPANPQDPYGRADNVPLNTTAGSYVVPKSVVDKKGSHFFDKIIAEHGDHADRAAAHLRLQGMSTMQGGGSTPVNVSGGEHIIPRSVVAKLGTHHFDKIVAKEGDRTDRQAAEMRLAGQPSGPGNGPPIPPNQLRGAIPRNNPLGRAP